MMMNGLLFLISLFVSVVVALAAIPPRSSENLRQNAFYIIVGKIKHILQQEVTTAIGTNIHYTVTVQVETVEQDESATLGDYYTPPTIAAGDEIMVHYWQTGDRPDGWSGPTGLYDQPCLACKGRLFLDLNEADQLRIMEPNGWQPIS